MIGVCFRSHAGARGSGAGGHPPHASTILAKASWHVRISGVPDVIRLCVSVCVCVCSCLRLASACQAVDQCP